MSQSAMPHALGGVDSLSTTETEQRDAAASGATSGAYIDPSLSREFDYRPVPVIAPATFVLGILSSIGLMGYFGLFFGLVGTILGIVSIVKIRRSCGELSGQLVAWIGCVLSFLFLVSGSTLHAYTYATEVPDGYQRVNFYRDISKKGFAVQNGRPDFHPDVKALDNKPIFIKGYMYPTRQTESLGNFLLVKDSGECCFGGQPQMTDMMMVHMQGGKTVDYKPGMVAVAGVFHCRPVKGLSEVNQNPVYVLDGELMESARTSF